jgi:hypothetical protein
MGSARPRSLSQNLEGHTLRPERQHGPGKDRQERAVSNQGAVQMDRAGDKTGARWCQPAPAKRLCDENPYSRFGRWHAPGLVEQFS